MSCTCPLTLFKRISDGVLITDKSEQIVLHNPSAIEFLHLNSDQILKSRLRQLFPQLGDNWWQEEQIHNVCFLDDEGGVFDLTISLDCSEHRVVLFHDYEYQMEHARNQIIKSNNQFISFLSHEIRNPLQSITMAAQMIKHINKNPKIGKYQEIIEKSARELRKIVNDVLDLGKIEAGELSIEEELVHPADIVRDIISSYQDIAHKTGLKLEKEIEIDEDIELQPFYSDYIRIIQIMSNLVSNGIKYSNEGIIRIILSLQEDSICFQVVDTGIGICEADMDKLFKSKIRLQNKGSLKKKFQSDGIGLLISSKLAELLGGKITVDSEVDQGSRFTLKLPYQTKSSLTHSVSQSNLLEIVPLQGTILVAEDSESNLELIKDIINQFTIKYPFDLKLHCVSSGIETLKVYQSNPHDIDLFLLDINMDPLDGLQTCKIIRDLDANRQIVALTGNIYARNNTGQSPDKFQVFNEVVMKPCTEEKLLNLLLKYLSKEVGKEQDQEKEIRTS